MMVVAERSRKSPRPVFVLPQMNKARLAGSVRRFGFGVQKAMYAHFDRAISLHVVNLQRAGHQYALRVSGADVVLNAFR